VEELTLQLADAVKERRRLEGELAEARAAVPAAAAVAQQGASSPTAAAPVAAASEPVLEDVEVVTDQSAPAAQAAQAPVQAAAPATTIARADIAGCDVTEALAGYDGKRAGNEALTEWLKTGDNLERCTKEQLQEIRGTVKWDWLGYQKEPLRILDKEIARR
jgi:hypothetical protein